MATRMRKISEGYRYVVDVVEPGAGSGMAFGQLGYRTVSGAVRACKAFAAKYPTAGNTYRIIDEGQAPDFEAGPIVVRRLVI